MDEQIANASSPRRQSPGAKTEDQDTLDLFGRFV